MASGEMTVTLNFLTSSFRARVILALPMLTITIVWRAMSRCVDPLLQHSELAMKQGRRNCEPGLCAEGIS